MDVFEPFLWTVYEFTRQPEVILFPDDFCEGDSFADGIEDVEHMFLYESAIDNRFHEFRVFL